MPTVTIEIPADSEALVRQLLALHEELHDLALSAPDGTVLDACEEAVVHKGRDLHKNILAQAVARRIEAAEKKGAPIRICSCGRPKENRGKTSRQFVTTVGTLNVERRYRQCRCGADGSYAADDVIGLTSRYSKIVQKHTCRLAADVSFAKTGEHLREMLDVRLAAETARSIAESHGKAMAAFQPKDETTAQAFREAKGEVEFAVDAGKVNTREKGWKDVKISVISKREAGTAATPDQWQNDGRLPAATIVVAFAMIAASKVFRRCWKTPLKRLGVTAFEGLHALGDGASWIWKSVDRVLTGCTQTLDIYHASERLSRCAQKIFGKGTAEATAAFERRREKLLSDGWSGICAWVADLLSIEDVEERERRRRRTDKLVGYFSKHVGRLNYRERLASGRAIGSGAVEGQAKTLGLRLKSRGACWCMANVRPMASLVCVRNSVQWDAYWSQAA